MTCFILLAGGKGTRLKKIFKKKSKCLIKVNKETLLEKIYNKIKSEKFKKIYIIINKSQKDVINFIGKKKLKIKIILENEYLGDGGALTNLKNISNFQKENFIIINTDLVINFNFKKFIKYFIKFKTDLCIVSHPNDHPQDSDLLVADKKNKLTNFYAKPHNEYLIYKNLTSAGIYFIRGKLIKLIPNKQLNFNNFLIPFFLKKKIKIYIYKTTEFLKDVGTINRLKYANKLEKSEKFLISSHLKKKPAIFLDRDGVINKEINYKVEDPSILIPGTAAAIKKINNSKYLSIIITNQPSIAKGFITEKELDFLHQKLETKLGQSGSYVNDIFYCPHHPHKGYDKEVESLKINCMCRKPKIGLILQAKKKYNIDLKKSFFIGNSEVDRQCAKNANINYLEVNKKNKNLFYILKKNQKLIGITF